METHTKARASVPVAGPRRKMGWLHAYASVVLRIQLHWARRCDQPCARRRVQARRLSLLHLHPEALDDRLLLPWSSQPLRCGFGCRRRHNRRHKGRRTLLHRRSLFARFPAPSEDLLRPQAIAAGDLGNDCVRLQRLRDDPRFVIHRPLTPAASTVDYLETSRLPLRVKRKVKSRHKPISDPNAEPATSQIATTPERWSRNTAYITHKLRKNPINC